MVRITTGPAKFKMTTKQQRDLESHPAAKIFPMMDGQEMRDLAADIAKHGLLDSILLHEGMILDGRNRFAACRLAGVEPRFLEWLPTEQTPTEFVLSINLKRRQLTPSQRAAIAISALPLLQEEAKERQRLLNGKTQLPVKLPEAEKGEAREKAAAALSVSPSYVQAAKKIQAEAPEKFESLLNGQKTISEIKREIQAEKNPEPETADALPPVLDADDDDLFGIKAEWSKLSISSQRRFKKWLENL